MEMICRLMILAIAIFNISCNERIEKGSNKLNFDQNGNLEGFHATDEYCDRMYNDPEKTKPIIELSNKNKFLRADVNNLYDSTKNSVNHRAQLDRIRAISDSTYTDLNNLFNEMMNAAGGYCYNGFPILPERTVDLNYFWFKQENSIRLVAIINRFNNSMKEIVGEGNFNSPIHTKYFTEGYFLNKNTLEAILSMDKIRNTILVREREVIQAVIKND